MIHDLLPYPAMRDSGVPWLGPVPEHWAVQPALAVYKPREVKNTGLVEKTVLSLSYGRIIIKPEEKLRGLVPESFETYQIVEPGNIIVRTTDLQNDRNSLRIGHAKNRGIITSAYMCLETTDTILKEFGYQYLNAYDLLKIIYGYGSGLRQNLDFKDIRRMPVLIPPLPEQSAIVRFLDHADRRIRKAIAAKQKLIRLLQEQKQVIIHQAVTRGLDPNVKLKPSGVEWLGDVPEGWEISTNRYIFKQKRNLVGQRSSDYTLLSLTLKGVIPRDIESAKGKFPTDFDTYQTLSMGQMVMCLFDIDETPRTVGLSRLEGMITGAYDVFDISSSVNSEYVYYWYLNIDNTKRLRPYYTGLRKVVPRDTFMGLKLPLPPVQEQREIVEFIETNSAALDRAVTRAHTEITLLREYRTRLIADVVTGKLDVRETAARLPELAEEAMPDEPDTEELEEGESEEAAMEEQEA